MDAVRKGMRKGTRGGGQPSGTSPGISGTIGHGNTITITPTGAETYGTRTVTVDVWDDASGTDPSSIWSGLWPSGSGSDYNLDYRTPSEVTTGAGSGTGESLPHTYATQYLCGAQHPGTANNAGWNVIPWVTYDRPSGDHFLYAHWYIRYDNSWTFGLGNGDDNHKNFAYSTGGNPYNLPNNWYSEHNARFRSATGSGKWQLRLRWPPIELVDDGGNEPMAGLDKARAHYADKANSGRLAENHRARWLGDEC